MKKRFNWTIGVSLSVGCVIGTILGTVGQMTFWEGFAEGVEIAFFVFLAYFVIHLICQ